MGRRVGWQGGSESARNPIVVHKTIVIAKRGEAARWAAAKRRIRARGVCVRIGGRILSPSPSTLGEASGSGDCPRAGWGEGHPDRTSKTLTPRPLPEYRERERLSGPLNLSRTRAHGGTIFFLIDAFLVKSPWSNPLVAIYHIMLIVVIALRSLPRFYSRAA